MLLIATAPVALALQPAIQSQTSWTVGPGASFSTIQEAIDASSPGDLIIVRAGIVSYRGFKLSKGVTILPDTRSLVVSITSDVVVADVPIGQRVVLKGLEASMFVPFTIQNNQGTICMEWCRSEGLWITNCANVFLNFHYGDWVTIDSSALTANTAPTGQTNHSGYAISSRNSTIMLATVIVKGAGGNYDLGRCQVSRQPGPAFIGIDSLLILGRNASVLGGTLSVIFPPCPPTYVEADAIQGTNLTVWKDPGATIGRVVGSVTIQEVMLPAQNVQVGHRSTGRMDFDLSALPGSTAALIGSPPANPIATSLGTLYVDPFFHVILDVGTVDPTGHRRMSMLYPRDYPYGQAMYFQSLVVATTGIAVSTPSLIVKD